MNAFPLLQVSGITFSRGPQRLLAPITFTLQRGEFVWLTGPSGAGKTTLLKILASLLEPTAGEVRYNGQPQTALSPEVWRQRVSYVFQTPQLFGTSVYDNLALPYQIRQQPVPRARLAETLAWLNLPADLLDKAVDTLSGGEKQRVALLRNLQFPPEVLLLDEVTSALDEENKHRVRQLIAQQAAAGVAVLWISHDREELNGGQRVLTLTAAGEGQHESA